MLRVLTFARSETRQPSVGINLTAPPTFVLLVGTYRETAYRTAVRVAFGAVEERRAAVGDTRYHTPPVMTYLWAFRNVPTCAVLSRRCDVHDKPGEIV